jgi:hypothetical protein
MSGLKDWFDVFRCGTHLDHSGTLRTITESDIDRAIRSYRRGSAPVVIGHPTLNAPAFGWIDSFRRVGSTVQARCSQVADEFTDAVKRGLYKNRSLSFNRDGSFRHVGFLGAAAPAVKGLEEIQFSDSGDYITMEFSENEAAGAEVQSAAEVPAAEPAEPEKEAETEPVKADKAAAAEGPSQKVQADVKLTIEALTRKVQDLENKLSQEQTQRRKIEFAAYADDLIRDRRLEPGSKDKLLSTMEALHGCDAANFAAPESSSLNTFKELLNELLPERPRVSFVEFAAPERLTTVSAENPEELAAKARERIESGRRSGIILTASEAVQQLLQGR